MAGQDTIASNISAPNTSAAANAGASVSSGVAANSVDIGVYKDARSDTLPLLAGTQANQTSLVLVGAVLVALMLVVGLAVSRKEA